MSAEYTEHVYQEYHSKGYEPIHQREEIVRCRDCKHATMTAHGEAKYCAKWALPDEDGYGANPQVHLPGDFFCAWGERKN